MRFPGLKEITARRQANPFCVRCGSVIDGMSESCGSCGAEFNLQRQVRADSRIEVEASDTLKELRNESGLYENHADEQAATIQEQCPKCKHVGMSFRTAQLRSADEGQTIFYTCLQCKYMFSVNS